MSSVVDREVIHLSIGSAACEVTAHWSNLQGLAGTSSSSRDDEAPPCTPAVTHSTYQEQHYVPRALLLDRPQAFVRQQQRLLGNTHQQEDDVAAAAAAAAATTPFWTNSDRKNHRDDASSLLWSGRVEAFDPSEALYTSTTERHLYHHHHQQQQQQQTLPPDPFAAFFQDASTLAYAPHSRYRVPEQNKAQTAASYQSSGRHVDWDDEGEEEEDDDEEERERLARLKERQEQEWYESTCVPLQTQLDKFWANDSRQHVRQQEEIQQPATTTNLEISESALTTASWIDYWMPPYHPKSCLPLPQDSTVVQDWDDSYIHGLAGISQSWREDELSERLRSILEECDACQGAVLLCSNRGWSAGLSCSLLQELQDECPAAQRFVMPIDEPNLKQQQSQQIDEERKEQQPAGLPADQSSWHAGNVYRVHGPIEQGLALHQYSELAHAILPLSLDRNIHTPAHIAAALDCLTLPYRLSGKRESLVGLNSSHFYGSMSGNFPFGTTSKLTFREFLGQLRPSSKHMMFELDMMLPETGATTALESRLQAGTSLERDRRMRQRGSSRTQQRDDLPGTWMLQAGAPSDSMDIRGLMTCMSPLSTKMTTAQDRSQHFHFALSTALRPSSFGTLSLDEYMTCLMEGTGPRFQPEQSTATVLRQSLEQLTTGGYGAGSYWKTTWGSKDNDDSLKRAPVLAVLGNTTRRYGQLDQLAADMKQALSPKLRGFYNRGVMQGTLLEAEDCQESLSTCLDLRDTYMPPSGSGIVDGAGAYLDDF